MWSHQGNIVKCDPLIVDPSGKHQCILTGLEKCSAVKHLLNNNGSKAVSDSERVILQFWHTSGSRHWTCSMIMIITLTYKGWIVEGFIVAALNRGDCCNAKYIWTMNLFVGTLANVIVDLIRIVDSHLLALILYYNMVILLFKIILLILISYEVGILMWLQHTFTEVRNHAIRRRTCLFICLQHVRFYRQNDRSKVYISSCNSVQALAINPYTSNNKRNQRDLFT